MGADGSVPSKSRTECQRLFSDISAASAGLSGMEDYPRFRARKMYRHRPDRISRMWDILLTECRAATMDLAGRIADAAIAIADGRLAYVGPRTALPEGEARVVHSLGGAWVLPGFVDCHTHLVYAGNRDHEAVLRAQGASYEDIARAGGGIMATVRDTRAASEDALLAAALPRALAMVREGVTTVEIKSGYGLDFDTELKLLRVAAAIGERAKLRVCRTLLAAHALPPEFAADREGYIRLVVDDMIPAVAREHLADAVDVFCETIAFTPAETERIFAAAQAQGLHVKLHADQRSDLGGGALAAKYRALSADHLEHLSAAGVTTMAAAGTVAVLLPYAFHYLGDTHRPPIEALRRDGVPIAIATDCNPGTSPIHSPLRLKAVAERVFGLTPDETLFGLTINGARALGIASETGSLAVGKAADLAIWDVADPFDLTYQRLRGRCWRGQLEMSYE
jgi:imidazolonepropionase